MTVEKFQELKSLDQRIQYLKFVENYFTGLLNSAPVDFRIECEVMGKKSMNVLFGINEKTETMNASSIWQEDREFIFAALKGRIKQLEEEFENK